MAPLMGRYLLGVVLRLLTTVPLEYQNEGGSSVMASPSITDTLSNLNLIPDTIPIFEPGGGRWTPLQ